MSVPIFHVAFTVHSETLTRAQISDWAGVESDDGFDFGDPVDPLDPEGNVRRHSAWSFSPQGVEESDDAEPWMEQLRPILARARDRPLPDTIRRVFVGVHNGTQSGWFYLDAADLALIVGADCALEIHSYDYVPEDSRIRRVRHWVLEKAGVYRRRRAKGQRARDRARAERIAARKGSLSS